MSSDLILYRQWHQTKDSEAFRELIERHADMAYAVARRILANPEDAEDVAQECFEKLAIGNVAVGNNLAGWIYRSAVNRALDRVRSDGARRLR